ncbi:cytochrome P450 [Rhizophagus irregularis]|uniref:Cytochrome P450 n=1 Tax=Rhizophagus irregularis TaxID=588596 RepID=A0A2N0PPC6_9GLOM|nr:cytochrome P450 [Rhizophagus irregularis]
MTYVTYYYYKYFTRVNPLPCLFPFPLIDIFPYVYLWFNGDIISFVDYCYEKYGDIYEVYGSVRSIILCRGEYLDDFSSNNTHEMKFRNCQGAEELGLQGKGLSLNNDYKSWMFNHHFFNQAILSPRFTTEAIDQTNKLFNELEIYWTDEVLKSMEFINQRLDAIIKSRREEIKKTPLDEPLPHDMLTSMIIKNTLRDDNYIHTGVTMSEAMRSMSDTEIRVNILDGIHTGTYKTANMLSLIVYYIAHNPDVKRKMLKEIDSIFQGRRDMVYMKFILLKFGGNLPNFHGLLHISMKFPVFVEMLWKYYAN